MQENTHHLTFLVPLEQGRYYLHFAIQGTELQKAGLMFPNPHSKSMDSPGSQGISVSDLALNPLFHAISQKNQGLSEYVS